MADRAVVTRITAMTMQAKLFGILMLTALVAGALPSAASAQGFKWWQNERFQEELALTPQQVTRLEEIFQAKQPKLRRQKEAFDVLEASLSKLVADGRATEADAAALIDEVEAARSAFSKSRTLMLFKMRRILTSDQHVKLTALHQQWERERRSRGGHRHESVEEPR
jgi:Spy/CpxP family protein refolding chaperone